MPRVKHCGRYRRAQTFWLHAEDKSIYQYDKLMVVNCPDCGYLVLTLAHVFEDMRQTPSKTIRGKLVDKWIARTHPITGDIAKDMDSNYWSRLKNAVHWVNASSKTFPYNKIRVRVQ
tara:strand:+ start:47 stop:397 length:351 start_codon:yes stop_codon:yes gene_type:complete